jgi:hypothetical protein
MPVLKASLDQPGATMNTPAGAERRSDEADSNGA